MNEVKPYHIKRLNNENLSDAEQLHAVVYGKKVMPGFFKRKYDTAFTGVEHIGFIAYNQLQQPIGFYAVIPCFMQAADEIILAAQSADTMTHPDYRKQGLFVDLALRTFQLCRDVNIRLLFGFPNQHSLPGFLNKLGWQVTDTMDCFIISSSKRQWRHFLTRIPLINFICIFSGKRALKECAILKSGITNSVLKDGYTGVCRDIMYLKYKTYNKTQVIKIGRSALWVKVGDVFLIGDISVLPNDFDDMIYGVKKLAGKLSKRQIHFHASPGTSLHGLFAMRFKSIPSFRVICKPLTEGIRIDQLKFTSADIDTF